MKQRCARHNTVLTLLFSGVALAVVAGLIAFVLHSRYSSTLGAARINARFVSFLIANHVDKTFSGVRQVLLGLSSSLEMAVHSHEPFSPAIRELLLAQKKENPAIADLLVLDAEGRIVHWSGEGVPPIVDDRDYVGVHLHDTAGDLFIGAPHLFQANPGRWVTGVSLGIRDRSGDLRRIMVALYDLQCSLTEVGGLSVPHLGTVVVADPSGTVLMRYPGDKSFAGVKAPGVWKIWTQGERTGSLSAISPFDGIRRVVGYSRVGNFPLIAFASYSQDEVLADWRKECVILVLGGGLILAVFTVLTVSIVQGQRYLEEKQKHLVQLASTDPLTDVFNRRHFQEMAEAEFRRVRRYGGKLSCFIMDVDHFKGINDQYGHDAGDRALVAVAGSAVSSCRSCDIFCRYGGEEFVALLPGTDISGAISAAEKIRAICEKQTIDLEGDTLRLTASFGVAELLPEDESIENMLARADAALYEAKRRGRNRVCTDGECR